MNLSTVCAPKLCSACCMQGSISQLGTPVQPTGEEITIQLLLFPYLFAHVLLSGPLQDGRVRPTKLEPPPVLNISLRSPCLTADFCFTQIIMQISTVRGRYLLTFTEIIWSSYLTSRSSKPNWFLTSFQEEFLKYNKGVRQLSLSEGAGGVSLFLTNQ